MGMLSKFVAGASEAAGEQYERKAKAQLEEVRQRRIAAMSAEASDVEREKMFAQEELEYTRDREREVKDLADPESPMSLKERREMDRYEEKLQLQQKYKDKSPSGRKTRLHSQKIYDKDGIVTGEKLFLIDDESGTMREVGVEGDAGPQMNGGVEGEGEVDPTTSKLQEIRARTRGGDVTTTPPPATEVAQVEPAEETTVNMGQATEVTPSITPEMKAKADLYTVNKVIDIVESDRTKMTPGIARAQLNRLKNVGDVGTLNFKLRQIRNKLENIVEGS